MSGSQLNSLIGDDAAATEGITELRRQEALLQAGALQSAIGHRGLG